MQQFAIASIKPRSIAWLIRLNEWERFEIIVQYNCAMVGGYFNVVIPLTSQDTVSEEYQNFLIKYDPDFLVLSPEMTPSQLGTLPTRLHCYGIISWESITQIATLDPWSGGTGINATLGSIINDNEKVQSIIKVAVADNTLRDASRLAMVACGDVRPREPLLDDDMDLDATGYREVLLAKILKPKYQRQDVEAQLRENLEFIPAPNRYELAELILKEHQFPLNGVTDILKTSFRLQHHPRVYQTFIGSTAYYRESGTPRRIISQKDESYPSLVILVSDAFELEEAILFWNLRASGVYITWLSFFQVIDNFGELAAWLDYNYGGVFYSLMSPNSNIAFSASNKDITRLQSVVDTLQDKRRQKIPSWHVVPYEKFAFYNYIRPPIAQERVLVTNNGPNCSFLPKLPSGHYSGTYTTSLQWNGCMLPQSSSLVHDLISSATIKGFIPLWQNRKKAIPEEIVTLRFRINNERYLVSQIDSDHPIEFNRPTSEQIIETIFVAAGYSRIEPSSTARYHKNFVERAGSLENAAHYLSAKPHRELLEILADNRDKSKTGWRLENPSKRRVLHHFYLREVLEEILPEQTREYFDTVSDKLSDSVVELLEKGILERGFRLKCSSCSFTSWYPAEQVGQTFKCTQCYQEQVYKTNPLWLYKLAEVVFRGFEDNMQVPLLALNHLKNKSKHHFEWIPDSDVYWLEDNEELHQNIDLLCLSDGKLYIGEAKSNDEIKREQFSFYERVCKQVEIDGIIFATSKPQWSRATLQRIEQLKAQFDGNVLIFTGKDLYPSI